MKVSLVVLGAVHQSLRTTFFSFGFLRLGCVSLIISWVSPLFASSNYLTTRWATLEAIHHVENPRNVSRPGSYGELGAYQFRRSTWKSHTKVPFSRAIHRDESDRVAVKHYEWLKRGLVRNGMPITPYNIALGWNGGLDAMVKGSSPRRAHEYAGRVANLAPAIEAEAKANRVVSH